MFERFKRTTAKGGEESARGFMQELDDWTDHEVVQPILIACAEMVDHPEYKEDTVLVEACRQAKQAIRAKVLESYRTGDEGRTHMHVIGSSGSGKSKFLEHLMRQDLAERRPFCLIDPHGSGQRAWRPCRASSANHSAFFNACGLPCKGSG